MGTAELSMRAGGGGEDMGGGGVVGGGGGGGGERGFCASVDSMKELVCGKLRGKTGLDWDGRDGRNGESISGKYVICFVRQSFEGKTSCSIDKVVELRQYAGWTVLFMRDQ